MNVLPANDATKHPLNPLTKVEYTEIVALLRREGLATNSTLFPLITLAEPAKSEVLRWTGGEALPRMAFVIAKQDEKTFESVVDITHRKIRYWKLVEGVQPNILLSEEWTYAWRLVLANPEWRAAARKRGIVDFEEVICSPHTMGYFATPENKGRRLLKVLCYQFGAARNFWGRPIEGLIAVVDLNAGKVVRVIDQGTLPLPKGAVDIDEASVGPLRQPPNALTLSQPQGPSFRVDGHVVSWQKWQFHFRIDPRLGLIVSLVKYEQDDRLRSILYQGSVSELFVPYMAPDEGWYFRTYFDAGEYGLGKLLAPLEPGQDCPRHAVYFDTVLANDWGEPYTAPRAACLFERYTGDMAWRHYEAVHDQTEVRRRTDLVLRFVAAIGNYDYVFDYVFRQDGAIRISVGASGTEQVMAVNSRSIADEGAARDTAYGRMVAEHTVAINHDHFFCFRLDLDVDGPRNSFLLEALRRESVPPPNRRKSIWVVDPKVVANENAARIRINLERPALWRVINPNQRGPLGYPTSYQLKPEGNAVPLLSQDDYPQQRAGFTDYHLWVTPYHPRERYAGGTYPNQSKGGDGLPRWTRANRPIENTDIVLWYTLGFHHVVRAEDWPVLPTNWHTFELKPFDFFERNPALDLPKSFESAS